MKRNKRYVGGHGICIAGRRGVGGWGVGGGGQAFSEKFRGSGGLGFGV